jgi:GntR family transcriptional regulator
MIHLNYRDTRPIYSQIVDGFREQITAGVLLPGEKLPSVRDLATELAINPNTIQRAYRQLESEGWISSIQGKGCFVTGAPDAHAREQQRLLREFDHLVQALERCGISREELSRKLMKEE